MKILEKIGFYRPRLAFAVALSAAFASGPHYADETTIADSAVSQEISAALNDLNAESYATRENAGVVLEHHPQQAIEGIRQLLLSDGEASQNVAPEAAFRMVRLLDKWLGNPNEGPSDQAFLVLDQLSRSSVSAVALRASESLQRFALKQNIVAIEELRALGVTIGRARVQVVTSMSLADEFLLKIDDNYQGSVDDLKRLRWLLDVKVVNLSGEKITREIVEQVVMLPNVRVIQLREVNLTTDDIDLLGNVRELETVELLYVPVDASVIPVLAELPVTKSIRLFGTNIEESQLDSLKQELEGVDIVFGRGGFLGVVSLDQHSTFIRSVSPNSAAELAGIQPGDRLDRVNDVPIDTFDELRIELGKYKANEGITITVSRPLNQNIPFQQGPMREFDVQVMLGEQPTELTP